MPESDRFVVVWYTDYLGIGYLFDGSNWNVFPLFTNSSDAQKIWDEHIEPLDEKRLRMRFIELNGDYEFVLYPYPFSKERPNFGFYRHLDSSETYNVFKQKFQGKAFFRFGKFGTGPSPLVFHKFKMVTDIRFMKSNEVIENSPEWLAREIQRRARSESKSK